MEKKITKIEKQTKRDRYNIYLNGVYSFSLSSHVLVDCGLEENHSLTDRQIEEIKNADETGKAYNRAILILSYRANTESELKRKLTKNFDEATVEKVAIKLKGQGLINDTDFAERYIKQSKKGKRLVSLELMKKGVDKETISFLMQDKDEEIELENALKTAERTLKKYEKSDIHTQKTKIYESLTRKGFSYDIFKQVVKRLEIR
ncbi:MAG: RecX family transcriptional regulator [Patescibacteria group bacterium]